MPTPNVPGAMERLSASTSGTVIAVTGLVLAAVHLQSAVRLRSSPGLVLIEAVVPLVLALAVAGVGGALREDRLAPPESADRVLGWAVVGTLSLSVAVGWLFVDAGVRGWSVPVPMRTVLNAATLGALVGLVVGVYDARARRQRERAEQLTRINDTLRIATREIVNATERAELEAVVCRRLTDSDIYDGAWIGRYEPGDEVVTPAAWAGHDDEYFAPLEIGVDPDDPDGGGPGSEAIRTGEIQPIQDVFAESTLEPWYEMLSEKGVESLAVVPLVGPDRVHGFLSVYANRANVFGAREREALSELGESIGHALDSMAARDRLARRERELARQNGRLDEFASVVSHDLRNPLNVAEGNLELARMAVEDEHLDRVADALDRMHELIEDLLTLARSGRTVDDVRPVDLRSVAERAWATTDTEGAQLVFDGDPGTVRADESRLTQVFENLFRNCVEHGSTGSRTGSEANAATITVGGTGSGFYVADDGPGIPESMREDVFEAGYTTATDGTGFGLDIVRTIATAHGWRVAVVEGTTGGARFEFTTADAEATGKTA
jgi:signal transduction histidine kinase